MNLTITDVAQQRLDTLVGEQMREQGKAIRVFMQQGGCGCANQRPDEVKPNIGEIAGCDGGA